MEKNISRLLKLEQIKGQIESEEYQAGRRARNRQKITNIMFSRFANFRPTQITEEQYDSIDWIDMAYKAEECLSCNKEKRKECNGYRIIPVQLIEPDETISYELRAEMCPYKGDEQAEDKVVSNKDRSFIPKHRTDNTFDNYQIGDLNYQVEQAKFHAKEAANHNKSLILGGGVGTGKTHLSIAIALHVIEKGGTAIYCNIPEMMGIIRSELMNNSDETLNRIKECDCLIFDDLGVEKLSEWRGEILYEIINSRYNEGKQIIITTNARSYPYLMEHLGPRGQRIVSRLKEMCIDIWMNQAGDYRVLKKKQTL